MKTKLRTRVKRAHGLTGLAVATLFGSPLASSLTSVVQAQVVTSQNRYRNGDDDDDWNRGGRRRGDWNRPSVPTRPSTPSATNPAVLPPGFYGRGVTPPGQRPPGYGNPGTPLPPSGRWDDDESNRDWNNRGGWNNDWRNGDRNNRGRGRYDRGRRNHRDRWNNNGNWNGSNNWNNNGNWNGGSNWDNSGNRDNDNGYYYSVQGRVIQDLAGNSFIIRTSNGRQLRVHLQALETGRLDRGDWVQVYGRASGSIFHAQSLRILGDR